MEVLIEKQDSICTIIINRSDVRNAVDRNTADKLADAFRVFDRDDGLCCVEMGAISALERI